LIFNEFLIRFSARPRTDSQQVAEKPGLPQFWGENASSFLDWSKREDHQHRPTQRLERRTIVSRVPSVRNEGDWKKVLKNIERIGRLKGWYVKNDSRNGAGRRSHHSLQGLLILRR